MAKGKSRSFFMTFPLLPGMLRLLAEHRPALTGLVVLWFDPSDSPSDTCEGRESYRESSDWFLSPRPITLTCMPADDPLATRSTLLQRLRDRNDEAWSEFHALYRPLLNSYLGHFKQQRNLDLDEADHEQIVQDILIKLFRHLPTFELDQGRGRFRTWLWTVAYNAAVDCLRAKRRRRKTEPDKAEAGPESLEALAVDDMPTPDRQLMEEDDMRVRRFILEKAQAEMQSAHKWDCFDRHFLQGKKAAEVAAELGLSTAQVYTYTSRVLERVRALCQEYEVAL